MKPIPTVRGRTLVLLLLLVAGFKVAGELYRWVVFDDEREQLGAMRSRLVDAGVDFVRAQARLDTLRVEIEGRDQVLSRERRTLDAHGRRAAAGSLPTHLYAEYRDDLSRYNQRVDRRNTRFHEWEVAVERKRQATRRYNALTDSIREVARVLGDPYYPIPTPPEAAVERGLVQLAR